MTAAERVALVHRYFDALNRGDAAGLAALVAPQWQQHLAGQTTVMNPTQMLAALHANFADLRYTVLDAFSDDADRATARWTYSGTPIVPLRLGERSIPPTGRAIAGHALGIFRIADDRIAESWIANDMPRVLADVEAAHTEANKVVVRRLVEEVWNRANPAAADELIAADHPVGGPAAVRANISSRAAARPDLHYTIDTLVAEGDVVVLRWTSQGTLRAGFDHPVFGHVAPTGQPLTETGINIFHVVNGTVVEGWAINDAVSLGKQLGVLPTVGRPPASGGRGR
jgi:predicted ester cyclase